MSEHATFQHPTAVWQASYNSLLEFFSAARIFSIVRRSAFFRSMRNLMNICRISASMSVDNRQAFASSAAHLTDQSGIFPQCISGAMGQRFVF
jgi:hypothetical protein